MKTDKQIAENVMDMLCLDYTEQTQVNTPLGWKSLTGLGAILKDLINQGKESLTLCEMDEEQQKFAKKIAKRYGYHGKGCYTSTSDMPGVHFEPTKTQQREATVIYTKEFGFMFVQDLEDLKLWDLKKEETEKWG